MEKCVRHLIVPDVHGRGFWRESVYSVLDANPDIKIIFLGDYLDPYQYEGVTRADAIRVFDEIINLKKNNDDRISLLVGNHDLHYIQNHRDGSRMDKSNKYHIMSMFRDNIRMFDCCLCDTVGDKNVIFSHAGFTKGWILDHIDELCPTLVAKYKDKRYDLYKAITFDFVKSIDWNSVLLGRFGAIFSDCSYYRGGSESNSSFLWTDIREMLMQGEFIDAVQVFGHSQQKADPVNYKDFIYCLDCRVPFVMYDDATVADINGNVLPDNGFLMREWLLDNQSRAISLFGY